MPKREEERYSNEHHLTCTCVACTRRRLADTPPQSPFQQNPILHQNPIPFNEPTIPTEPIDADLLMKEIYREKKVDRQKTWVGMILLIAILGVIAWVVLRSIGIDILVILASLNG